MRSWKLQISLSTLLAMFLFFATSTDAYAVIKTLNGQTGRTQTFQNDSSVGISSANNVHSIFWQGLLSISRGGTGASSFTGGSIPFIFNGIFTEDNSNLFWDNTNKRLGVGTSSPTSALEVSGNTKVTSLTTTADSIINTLKIGLGGGSDSLNIAIGANALLNNTIGSRNVAVGFNTLASNIEQHDSTAIGFGALANTTGGEGHNTAVGSRTLSGITNGSYNSAFGDVALWQNTSGNGNTAIGSAALFNNTLGSNNVALGYASLSSNTTGGANVAIGDSSFLNLIGAGNIAVGQAAARHQADGNTPLTTANNSIYIGTAVQGYDNNDFNSIVIGTSAIGAGANKTVIGNSSMTDVYFGSSAGLANIHAKKLFLGASSIPGCIIMGDSDGVGVTYLTVNDGVLTASTTAPSACQ